MHKLPFKKRLTLIYIKLLELILNNALITRIFNILAIILPKTILPTFSISKIAFIMDGNRRFAKKHKINENSLKTQGFEKMIEIIQACQYFGLKEMSFFAFSISNFGRNFDEINSIYETIILNYQKLLNKSMQNTRITFYGRRDLIRRDIADIFDDVENKTCKNDQFKVNIFFAYSSSDEISYKNEKKMSNCIQNRNEIYDKSENKVKHVIFDSKVNNEKIPEVQKKRSVFDSDVDVLIRTSGERRLSDFMLEQVARGTYIEFCKCYWPEFTIFHLFLILHKISIEKSVFEKS